MTRTVEKYKRKKPTSLAVEKAAKDANGEITRRNARNFKANKQTVDVVKTKRCYVSLKKSMLNPEADEDGQDVAARQKDVADTQTKIKSQTNARTSRRIAKIAPKIDMKGDSVRRMEDRPRKISSKNVGPKVTTQEKHLQDEDVESCIFSSSVLDSFLKSPKGNTANTKNHGFKLSLSSKRRPVANPTDDKLEINQTVSSKSTQSDGLDTNPVDIACVSSVSKSTNAKSRSNDLNNSQKTSTSADSIETEPAKVIITNTKRISPRTPAINKTLPSRNVKRCSVQVCQVKCSNKVEGARRGRPKKLPTVKQIAEKTPKPQTISKPRDQSSPPTCTSPDIFSDAEETNEPDIYAFNTQSSQSEHEDVAADIIEKMKKEGKIKVAKPRNKVAKKTMKKTDMHAANWRTIAKNLSIAHPSVDKKKRKVANTKPKRVVEVMPADDDDHFDADFGLPEDEASTAHVSKVKTPLQKSSGFSALAQNVLRKETAKNKPVKTSISTGGNDRNLSKTQLLQIAQKFVADSNISHSTPNKPPSSASSASRRSNASPSSASSPWRVNSDSVPRLFYFSRTSDNLPSYSSDVIPSSQQNNKSEEKRSKPNKSATVVSPSKLVDVSLNISDIRNISPIKSRENSTLNISNIENISPVKRIEERTKDTIVLFGANPRRGLADRSPLKPINILDVVALPNRVNFQQIKEKSQPAKENIPQIIMEKSSNKPINTSFNNSTLKGTSMASDFFGFSDENELDDEQNVRPQPNVTLPNRKRLRNKLTKLKRLLPPKPTRISCETIRSIFRSPKKQPDIREMLSSTRNKSVVEHASVVDDSSSDEASSIAMDENDLTNVDNDLHLFDDPADPQPSFNASMKIRTYERPKRKVKKVHSFVMFKSDSESDEESPPVKTKRRKPDKNKKELSKFVDEFNSMCEEVDKYELVVEKRIPTKATVELF